VILMSDSDVERKKSEPTSRGVEDAGVDLF
jgi:hypothetical protein